MSVGHFLVLVYGTEMNRKYVPKGLTFAESFSVMAVNAHYLFFYIETLTLKLRGNDAFLVGNNNYNLLVFTPVIFDVPDLYSGPALT